jgi:pyruvate dehydrogenase E2 component (dihydrolipoamide acetyltransferase)
VLAVIGYILEPNEEPPDQWPEESSLPADAIIKVDSDEIKKQAVATPVAERMVRELGVELDKIEGSGAGGKITKEDVLQAGESSSTKTTTTTKRILASPRAKRLAIQKNISLNQVRGSGPKGRITEQDVIDFINSKEKPQLSRLQQITAKRMVESFTKAPHFYLKIEVDANELVDWHKKISPTLERKYQIHTTISDLLIFLVARTLKNHPRVNSHWIQDDIQINERVNLGLAVALEDGLTVPVIKDAHQKTVLEIARERTKLVEKAENGRLTFNDLEGGTFTITNLGMYGIDEFIAIINPPESAILAVGQIKERSVAVEGHTVVKPIVYLTLSIDHRVLDGSVSAKFLGDLKDAIEAPEEYFIFQTH